MIALILFGSFIAFLLIGVPVGIALGVSSIIAVLFMPFLNLEFLIQGLVLGLDSFPLIAVILFTLAGNIMSKGGISERLLILADAIFGRLPAGLGIVSIVACIFFASISGTGSATVAAIGLVMIPSMIKQGYGKGFAASVIASSGGIGVMIPPSVVMIVYAITAEVSVNDMFKAGIIPGVFVGLVLIAYCVISAKKKGYGINIQARDDYIPVKKRKALKDAFWSLLMPVIILGGIYSGIFTPTESAAIAVAYGFVFGVYIYKKITYSQLSAIILESAILSATVLVIVGTSVSFGRILAVERIPAEITYFILSVTENKILIMLAINVLLLIIGTFMETLAAIVILTPILLPITTAMGVNPVHFGIIMIVNLAIGFITPPLGANLFMASQVGKVPIEELYRSILGWVGAMIFALMVITYVPIMSLLFVG